MDNAVCSPDELNGTLPYGTLHCFTQVESLGLLFGTAAGFISLLSVLVFFAMIIRNVVREQQLPPPQRRSLIDKPMEIYLLSLFVGEFIHGLGVTLEFKWISDGRVTTGHLCTAQGLMMNVGSVTIALFTLVIAWYTFITVWWSKRMTSLIIPWVCSVALWMYSFLYSSIFISTKKHPTNRYYLPTPYWCWISRNFTYNRAAAEWFWLWFALFFCLVFCVLLYIRGRKSMFKNSWRDNNILHGLQSPFPSATKRVSYRMLLYAVSYCVLVLPMSVARWIQYALEARGKVSHVPPIATITVFSIFNLSGVVNVALFFFTRPSLLLFGHSSPLSARGRGPRVFTDPEIRLSDLPDVSLTSHRTNSFHDS